MDDIKILPNVSIPSVKLQSVRMPIVGNRITLPSGGGILSDLKSHMLGWYDVKRQGCTNESLTANPVLEDLSGNNHPLELKNFVFGGLSGMGTEMYPNSLVFNGVTPEYVINRDNLPFVNTNYGNWTSYNVAHIVKGTTNEGIPFMQYVVIGEKGKNLNINMPSFIIRRTGETKDIYILYRYQSYNGKTQNPNIKNINIGSSVIIPALVDTIEPYDEESTPSYKILFTMHRCDSHGVGGIPIDVKLEFLPNYPAPTTRMYGIIPTLTHGAKCMMMDFAPTYPINHNDYIAYYTQRQQHIGSNYILINHKDLLSQIAYNKYNTNGTYINGQYNNKLMRIDLLNKMQVVSVNANEVHELPANRGIVIAANETLEKYFSTMALNSLILFDRELTEEEMKLVMGKLMMYQDVDNIAAINQDIGLPIMGTADPNMDLD